MDLTRRAMLRAGAAVLAAAALPAGAAAATARASVPGLAGAPHAGPVDAPATPAWSVHAFSDEMRGATRIDAETREDAVRLWLRENCDDPQCTRRDGHQRCSCSFCVRVGVIVAERQPGWDGRAEADADWFDAGFAVQCARCKAWDYDELASKEDGRLIDGMVVHEDCMTMADWDRIDPARAAELRDDWSEDEA